MEVEPYEYTLVDKRGDRLEAIISTKLITYEGDMAVCGIVTDITARKRAETALRESEKRYRILFESAGDGIYVHDLDGNILDANQMQCERLGYSREEYLKLNLRDIVEGETADLFPERVRRLKKDGHIVLESVHIRKDGTKLPIETNSSFFEYKGKPAILAIIRDISERKAAEDERRKLEGQLQEAQKMEAIGTLAGGIAHDFNNLLMGIQGNASLLPFDLDPGHPKYEKARDKIGNIEHIVQSGGDLTRQLLGFASGGKYEAKPTDINDLIKKSAQLFGRTKKELAIHSRYQEGLHVAEVDRGQIEQVLLNLFVNAWHAMPDGGGELYLETENVFLKDAYTRAFGRDEGHYVKISVTDTGEGMDRQTREKIFDPFFTTKEMGRGTGLGLASAYGIIKNHGGIIEVYSEKGHGTTFNIYLPASSKTVLEERESSEAVLTFSGTALLVDDEEMIVDVGRKILKQLGFEVITAGGGEEALAIFMENRDGIDIVILDMIMPGMGGGVIYDRLKEVNPDVKVLLSSGYSINGEASGILARGCDGFIQKPFDLKDLSKKIGEIMGLQRDS
jgi:PAS domain S-box-containing protein